jgi:hypothetical protein
MKKIYYNAQGGKKKGLTINDLEKDVGFFISWQSILSTVMFHMNKELNDPNFYVK